MGDSSLVYTICLAPIGINEAKAKQILGRDLDPEPHKKLR